MKTEWTMRSSRTLMAAGVVLLSACATLPAGRSPDAGDPFERYNRAAFSFNDTVDRALFKPVARAYSSLTPNFVQRGIGNFFANLSDIPTAANDVLQGKPKRAATHLGRFAINSTVGLLGLFDLATSMDLPRQREDFGLTLGVWGLPSGPYLVLPIFGPSSIRDTAALPVDFGLDPVMYIDSDDWRYSLVALRVVELRASVLDIEKTIDSVELDPYLFARDAYLARRRSLVFDGSPPETPAAVSPPTCSAASTPVGGPRTICR